MLSSIKIKLVFIYFRDMYGATVENPHVKPIKRWQTLNRSGKYAHLPKSLQLRQEMKAGNFPYVFLIATLVQDQYFRDRFIIM